MSTDDDSDDDAVSPTHSLPPVHIYHAVVHVPVVIAVAARRRVDAQRAVLSRAAEQKPVYGCSPVILKLVDMGPVDTVEPLEAEPEPLVPHPRIIPPE